MEICVVQCDHCKATYPPVFRNDPTQGYGCATTRTGDIFIGHYGSAIADLTRYMTQNNHPAPLGEVFCDTCIEDLIRSGVIVEIVEEETTSPLGDESRALITSFLNEDQGVK